MLCGVYVVLCGVYESSITLGLDIRGSIECKERECREWRFV